MDVLAGNVEVVKCGSVTAMLEEDVRREVSQMLRYRYGLWPQHIPDVKGVKRPGVPDLIVMNPRAPGYYIEVKAFFLDRKRSFDFRNIERSQRNWLTIWEEQRPNGSYLAIGAVNVPHRELWIIPWLEWLEIEETLKPYQKSLPFIAGKGYSSVLQDNGLDFRMVDRWRCHRLKPKNRRPKESGWVASEALRARMEIAS